MAAVLLLVFPAGWGMDEETVSDEIHRVAGVVLLIAMPVAAWLLAPATATRATAPRWLSVLALTGTALFTVSQAARRGDDIRGSI